MPTSVIDLPVKVDPPRKLWTRAEYDELSSSGVLDQQKLELVEGELISKMGKKRPHVNCLIILKAWLDTVFGALRVNPDAPIDVAPEDNPTNEPEPDIVVLSRDVHDFTAENPRPRDILLVVEIADSTLGFDVTTKAALYARAGLVEYWVLDIAGRRMIVHRDPRGGRYTAVVAYSSEETLAALAAPDSRLRIADAFAR